MNYAFPPDTREIFKIIRQITEANPFSPERLRWHEQILRRPLDTEPLHLSNWQARQKINEATLRLLEDCLAEVREDIHRHADQISSEDQELYRIAVWFQTYHQALEGMDRYMARCEREPDQNPPVGEHLYDDFKAQLQTGLRLIPGNAPHESLLEMNESETAELFAFSFQLWRGFSGIIRRLIGRSAPAARLREEVWEAIFTRRLLWSFNYLKSRMANFSTLILGASGTGKDLVAEAIATAQFIPYDPRTDRFAINYTAANQVINLSALTPTLIESELFGHVKGAFTGATENRQGLLEKCSPYGALFLDEIGDLSEEIQVKLLRVLQSREFYPLGSRKPARFQGRILSATNRDIAALIQEGRMREDFLYRLGAVVIRVPTLSQRLRECPDEGAELLRAILLRVLGQVDETVYRELEERIRPWIKAGYPWPGNVREFEQCVRSMLVGSRYNPLVSPAGAGDALHQLFLRMEQSQAPIEEILAFYSHHVLNSCGNYQAAAERLGVDWRTVKKYVHQYEKLAHPG